MLTVIQRKHAVIKELNKVDPIFYDWYASLITNYQATDCNYSYYLNNIKHLFPKQSSLMGVLSTNFSNNLLFEILYQKLIDPEFSEDQFVAYPQI